VPQLRRRAEIARFREDPVCRLFLTSDAGATGLNLQAASSVINLDLPWNPAKLEQRIGRVWRKGQTQAVTVVNFVTENSIEHSILHLLAHKQTLADGVIDGDADFATIKMPSGRTAMIERVQAMLGQAKAAPIKVLAPEEALVEDLCRRHGSRFHHAEIRADRLFVVLDGDASMIAAEGDRLAAERPAGIQAVETIDHATWEVLQRFAQAGILHFANTPARILHRASPERGLQVAEHGARAA
jgi:Helicase conserved C-terminal domain